MDVQIEQWHAETVGLSGEIVKIRHGLDKVFVNGKHVGYVPIEGDKNAGVFHPLAGMSSAECQQIVDACPELTSSLGSPEVAVPLEEEDDE